MYLSMLALPTSAGDVLSPEDKMYSADVSFACVTVRLCIE